MSKRPTPAGDAITANTLYVGTVVGGNCIVTTVTGHGTDALPLRLDVARHSPTGFAWGYNGSGPAQLALALLCEVTTPEIALQHYQEFKRLFIARLPANGQWSLNRVALLAILEMVRSIVAEQAEQAQAMAQPQFEEEVPPRH